MHYQVCTKPIAIKASSSYKSLSFLSSHYSIYKSIEPTPQQYLLNLSSQCTTLKQLSQVHAHITTNGLLLTNPSFTLNTFLHSLSLSTSPFLSLPLLSIILRLCIPTQSFTFAFALKASSRSRSLPAGRSLHALSLKTGHSFHLFVATTAIHLYASLAQFTDARNLFDEMTHPNIVTWNALIAGFVRSGLFYDGLRAFHRLMTSGVPPNDVTMIAILTACAHVKEVDLGSRVHAYVVENWEEFEHNVNVGTAVIDMYAKCGWMKEARLVFDGMRKRDVGVWNVVIGGYVFNGCFNDALQVFDEMRKSGFDPDETTLVSTLSACTRLGALDVGKRIHFYAQEKGLRINLELGTALVDMYSKCGCIDAAWQVFNGMGRKDVMTWTSMITGLALHGDAKDALELFALMRQSGQKPDGVTFVGVLSACGHAGLVDNGLYYFELMRNEYNIKPRIEHYGCLIDLLGRAGQLEKAFKVISSMEIQPNAVMWRSFLSASRLQNIVEWAEVAVRNLFELKSDHSGDHILLSNLYSSRGRWEDAEKIRKRMKQRQVKKVPGLSLIGIDGELNTVKQLKACKLANH